MVVQQDFSLQLNFILSYCGS